MNREKVTARRREQYAENRDKVNGRRREIYLENVGGAKEKKSAYRIMRSEHNAAYQKNYREANKAYRAEYSRTYLRAREEVDIDFRLRRRLRARIYLALKGIWKSSRTLDLLGCSIEQLKQHLSEQFTPGMSWDNYGEWHIDHIRPCASFDLTDPEQQRQCFNYTNLQPLWAVENRYKRDKW